MMSPHERRRVLYTAFFVLGSLLWIHRILVRTEWSALVQMDVRAEALMAANERARLRINRADAIEAQFRERADELHARNRLHMAPAESPLAWARARLARASASSGFETEGINPIIEPAQPWVGTEPEDRGFGVFALRVDASATATQLTRFVRDLEAANPLVTLSSLTLYRSAFDEPELLRITMVWEWPQWRDTPAGLRLTEWLSEGR